MSDTNERSVASRGSVEPVAWAIEACEDVWSFTHMPHIARMWPQAEVVPLYRQPQPTLTDAERTLICRLAAACEGGHPREWTNRAADDRATLRGLLERLG